VRGTASGRLFAAFMPREQVLAALAAESGKASAKIDAALQADLVRIREERFCSLVDGSVHGINAQAAPVFDGFGKMVLALTAIGPSATLPAGTKSETARELARTAAAISAQLGARVP
jgi:DNA-binding IclR family transcriptional regulator